MTESANTSGPLRAPNWTGRETREAIALLPQTTGLNVRKPGWYEVSGGMALASDPTGDDSAQTLRVSVWDHDPRDALRMLANMPVRAMPVDGLFVTHWVQLLEMSKRLVPIVRASLQEEEAKAVGPLPEAAPQHSRACGNPMTEGHFHFGVWKVYFVSMGPDNIEHVRTTGAKPSEYSEVLCTDRGALIVERD